MAYNQGYAGHPMQQQQQQQYPMTQVDYPKGGRPGYSDTSVQMPAAGTVTVVQSRRWSWCTVGWAVFAVLCCPYTCVCSIPGLVYGMLAYTDHKTADYDRSRSKGNCGLGCTVTAIVLGLLAFIGIIVLLVMTPLLILNLTGLLRG